MYKHIIHITDNCTKDVIVDNPAVVENLSYILNKPIHELIKEENLLIFPHSLMDANDKIGDQSIGTLQIVNGQYKIQTSNVMGFVGKACTQ